MRNTPVSEKRQKLIDEKNNSPLQIGETIAVRYNALTSYFNKSRDSQSESCEIVDIIGDKITVKKKDSSVHKDKHVINNSDITSRDLLKIGANPFLENEGDIRPVAYSFDSILFGLNILGERTELHKDIHKGEEEYKIGGMPVKECNWNPFVYNKEGKKEYYQRPLVWSLQDKQLLIESIYQNIDCGKILVRKRGLNELEKLVAKGETELAFVDLVDGKQRLNAIKEFLEGVYPDMQGNYYGDLSYSAQRYFTSHQLFSYAEMPENTKDESVIKQFLKLNHAGVPQSKEHIEFVKSILNKIQ